MDKLDICKRTRKAREYSGIEPKEIAYKLGVEYQTYNKYEIRSSIKQHLIIPFCKLTGVNTEWLLTGNGEMISNEYPNHPLFNKLKELEDDELNRLQKLINPIIDDISTNNSNEEKKLDD